jgi:ubiquinone/menaquinone biosynthesis C-methylase UbiE
MFFIDVDAMVRYRTVQMERLPEPELMDDEQQSLAYAKADFSTSNQFFVDSLIRDFPSHLRTVVDIGCGPADVVIRLAKAAPRAMITAIDGSAPMIALGRDASRAAGVDDRLVLLHARIPGPPPDAHAFDAVLSKDLLHHLPDPGVLWNEVKRLGQPGAAVYVMDLVRPDSEAAAQAMVKDGAGSEDPILQRDFYNSLLAAFTLDEVRAQLRDAGLELTVALAGVRHMLIKGVLR